MSKPGSPPLPQHLLINLALGIARGINYLHKYTPQSKWFFASCVAR
jgi:hypothetical protein